MASSRREIAFFSNKKKKKKARTEIILPHTRESNRNQVELFFCHFRRVKYSPIPRVFVHSANSHAVFITLDMNDKNQRRI